jgi:hypothetical protein
MLHSLAVFYRMAVLALLSAALLPARQKTNSRPQAATPSPEGAKPAPVALTEAPARFSLEPLRDL